MANMDPTPAISNGIINLMTLVPAGVLLVSALLTLFFFSLNDKRVSELQQEIDVRKAQQA